MRVASGCTVKRIVSAFRGREYAFASFIVTPIFVCWRSVNIRDMARGGATDHVGGNEIANDHRFRGIRGERLRKQKSLRVATTDLLQPPQLLPRFDAFGNDVRPDASRQSD